ncbi:ribonuclease III [Cytophaga hutchinsonii]|uniref:Ribonuclease 3 n=1 Tax=Cytophaga hutchinsonii (strain ATCC 33406 / DSM 1761 / CIP 103989 / NBRC 15051 / NCIMB 9469 / D465) TaxID=269798 RepID=A0A6N4SQW0_CYTH3|nr:ribonuclease III [Cytophaga hutchinsonii]ABG58667.1 RNAse III [Cytophaga hutchinsonii ATCC 33406]
MFLLEKQLNILRNFFRKKEDKILAQKIRYVTGMWPGNLHLYQMAIVHTSAADENESGVKESYERLEYLGDSILGAVVAEYLFKRFPFKDEGFLTEIRSRIVNREILNQVGKDLGLSDIVVFNGSKGKQGHKSLYGDVVEAIVGAVYLDKGFENAKKFVLKKIVSSQIDVDAIIQNNKNFKSILLEWCQKENKKLEFVIIEESGHRHQKVFKAEVRVADESKGQGIGFSKKKAEQNAAEIACIELDLK